MTAKKTATRTAQWAQDEQPTLSDLRSLVEWLEHFGIKDTDRIFIRADDTQRDGYHFTATVSVNEQGDDS